MSRKESLNQRNLFLELLELRDKQRENLKKSVSVVEGDELPWEVNPFGMIKWYLHPSIEDTAIHSLMFYMQKIPAGSRSGQLRVQGGQVIHFMEGSGHTLIDDKEFAWEAGDVLQVPLRWEGVVFQHFNDDPAREALLICAEPNFVHSLGVDRGTSFEVLANAPEWRP